MSRDDLWFLVVYLLAFALGTLAYWVYLLVWAYRQLRRNFREVPRGLVMQAALNVSSAEMWQLIKARFGGTVKFFWDLPSEARKDFRNFRRELKGKG